jgi:diguanylate cyclase (GGDEF)-like protein
MATEIIFVLGLICVAILVLLFFCFPIVLLGKQKKIHQLEQELFFTKNGTIPLLEMEVNRYRQLAVRDELTGLLNRRGFRVSLDTVLGSFERGAVTSMSVVHIDLNDFKPINDMFGHEAGDEVLLAFATILMKLTRKTDIVARTGGDEFAIVFSDVKETHINNIIARAKRELQKYPYSFSNKEEYSDISLCFSFGISSTKDVKKSFSELLHEADRRCEENKKREGKGRR